MRLTPARLNLTRSLLALMWVMTVLCAHAADAESALAVYTSQAGRPADMARGQQFFTATHGGDWSCATCHTAKPVVPGKHASTGKLIAPMAPAFQPDRFSDHAKTEKWFRRNCNDVVGRECSASEKADVLAWLMTFKR
jgi:hypothetical protein